VESSTRAVSFHGVPVTLERGGERWLTGLLGRLETRSSEQTAELVVAPVDTDHPSLPALGARLFESERLSGYRSSAGLVVTNGRSWLEVARTPLRIHGQLASNPSGNEIELLHVAFLVALRQLRIFELHAAVTCHGETALVLVGPSGSGKSTTTLAQLTAGCECLGDDRVLFRERDGELELLRYPNPLRATPTSLSSFPAVHAFASERDHLGKRPVDVERAFPNQCRQRFSGKTTLLFPEIAPATALRELSPQSAFTQLLLQSGSLVIEGHGDAVGHLALLRNLVSRSRRFALSLGPEWLSHPERTAHALLDRLRADAATELPVSG
jgi:hypothetical protein